MSPLQLPPYLKVPTWIPNPFRFSNGSLTVSISSHDNAISLPPYQTPSMFSHNGFEHGRPFHHAILTSLSLIFLATLILLILSLYYYEYIISTPTFITSTNDGA